MYETGGIASIQRLDGYRQKRRILDGRGKRLLALRKLHVFRDE